MEDALDRDSDGVVLGVGEIGHEQADGHRCRRGARQRQDLDEECDPTRPPLLSSPQPREAVAPGITLPRFCGGGVGSSGSCHADDREYAGHEAAIRRQELEPRGQEVLIGVRSSSHDADSERLQCLAPSALYIP